MRNYVDVRKTQLADRIRKEGEVLSWEEVRELDKLSALKEAYYKGVIEVADQVEEQVHQTNLRVDEFILGSAGARSEMDGHRSYFDNAE